MTQQLDKRLIDMAKNMNLKVVLIEDYYVDGEYQPFEETIILNTTVTCNTMNAIFAHELIHASGHWDRLKRTSINFLKDPHFHVKYTVNELVDLKYAEEVVAEKGAMLLCDLLGVDYNSKSCYEYIHTHSNKASDKSLMSADNNVKNAVEFLMNLEQKAVA